MRAPNLRLVAAAALVAGVAGCSLPEVRPLVGATTVGPSPYGIWYEQHWATNAVLLAAADEAEAPADQTPIESSNEAPASEAAVSTSEETSQIPSEASREAAEASREAAEANREAAEAIEGIDGAVDGLPAKPSKQVPAPSSGPVRY